MWALEIRKAVEVFLEPDYREAGLTKFLQSPVKVECGVYSA